MSEVKSKGCLWATFAWILFVAIAAIAFRYLIHPRMTEKLVDDTGSDARFRHELILAADSFSGYSVLRSNRFRSLLAKDGIKVQIEDDGAKYLDRLKRLKSGKTQMAVFTVDSLIKAGTELGTHPATIILILDETKGADAIVCKKSAFSNLRDLDDPETRLVLTPNSPSEFLARIVIAHFNLPALSKNWMEEANGAPEVYEQFRKATPGTKKAYVLWEPYVSRALKESDAHLLLDSSKVQGMIVDVLVVERNYLKEHPEEVRQVTEAYLRASYSFARAKKGMIDLIMDDARAIGDQPLTEEQARNLVNGIQWKNTLENYTHFSLETNMTQGSSQSIEDIIGNITKVLVKSGALDKDPLDGKYHTLYYDRILAQLKDNKFHPGRDMNLIEGLDQDLEEQTPDQRPTKALTLSDDQWKALMPVGALRIQPLAFGRGTARINLHSQHELDQLAARLAAWPAYYLIVTGHTRTEGDPAANLELARQRAQAAADYLISKGIPKERVKAQSAQSTMEGSAAQSVSFVLGQLPY